MRAAVKRLRHGQAVVFLATVPDGDIPALYSLADLLVMPSLYEGFGLPPLEAMACGTPVICSDAASLLEVAGDATLTFPAHETDGLVRALRTFFAQPELAPELTRQGLARSRRFTWTRTAAQTIQVYAAAGHAS